MTAGSRAALHSPDIAAASSCSHAIAVNSATRLATSVRRRAAGVSASLSRSGAKAKR